MQPLPVVFANDDFLPIDPARSLEELLKRGRGICEVSLFAIPFVVVLRSFLVKFLSSRSNIDIRTGLVDDLRPVEFGCMFSSRC